MRRYAQFLLFMAGPAFGCEHVTADRIRGSDLARALPAFFAVPPAAEIGYAPAPGSKRVFRPDELNRIAARFGIASTSDQPICFDWELQPVSKESAVEAMRKSLDTPGVRIEIVRLSQTPAPSGAIVFPKSGLMAASIAEPSTALMWRGFVLYNGGRKFDLWAEVKISASMARVVAIRELAVGEPIPSDAVRLETQEDTPLRNDIARHLDEVVGHIPLRGIQTGAPVFRTQLAEPFDVKRGDAVEVRAMSGRAVLTMEGVAESSGRKGDSVLLKNPASGKIFRGRVEGQRRVLVNVGAIGEGKTS